MTESRSSWTRTGDVDDLDPEPGREPSRGRGAEAGELAPAS